MIFISKGVCNTTAIHSNDFDIYISDGVVNTSAVHNIDFDILTDVSIEMYIMVTDGKEHDEDVLAIQVQNLNERPSFSQTHYSISRNEGVVCIFTVSLMFTYGIM